MYLEQLRPLRQEKKLTMKELGEIVGTSEAAISTYETGKREPSLDVLCALADYFDVSLDYLVRGKEKDHSEEWSKQEVLKRLGDYSLEDLQDLMIFSTFLSSRKAKEQGK